MDTLPQAVAVYCGSYSGKRKVFHNAALSLGRALVTAKRPLVYGGGSSGIMGLVSGAVINGGGHVTGVIPFAMVAAGEGIKSASNNANVLLDNDEPVSRDNVETVVVNSMHERKVEMARRSCGFIGLPGGFGTFEEVLEVTTWTQIGIHSKPVILLNVHNYYDPLRMLIQNGVQEGFIQPHNESLITFVDGPLDIREHETFDWGKAALNALDEWRASDVKGLFDWTKRMDGESIKCGEDALGAS